MFADDVEYTTPHRTLRGLAEVRDELKWGTSEKDSLDVEVEDGDWQDLGGGSSSTLVQKREGEVGRWTSGIREGQITRLERVAQPE